MKKLLTILFAIFLISCAPATKSVLTKTPLPISTVTPAPPTTTHTPTSTPKPTKTPIPITYVTLGSIFATDCGDGQPRVLFDNAFNGKFRGMQDFTESTGHVDLIPPTECNAVSYNGEIIAPVDGTITPNNTAYFITLPPNTYLLGIEKVFANAGISDFSLQKISYIALNIAHFAPLSLLGHSVKKGQIIGDIAPDTGHANPIKLAFQINIGYSGAEYMFSPTRFLEAANQQPWLCITVDPPYACKPMYNNYPKH